MSKKKLIHCKSCDAEIAGTAKVCPHCGAKNKKPVYKRVWFWILIVLALFIALGSNGNSDEEGTTPTTEPVSTDAVTAEKEPPADTQATPAQTESVQPEKTAYQVGDSLEENDLQIVYMASGEYISDNEFLQPADGNKFIFLQMAFENLTKTSDRSVSAFEFECYADGYNAEMNYFGEEELSATLSAGRSTSGYLYFEVPADAQTIEIEYTPNVFSDRKITFLYEGDLDSGYILPTNTAATEDAIAVGQVAESKQLKISYLSCFEDSSDNIFITPKDGYRYITCEFEFENLSDSDQSVSAFSFDCYADGVNCEGSYFREDSLSATLSAGRKAKGTVTFEVPVDAAIVEVEYLSNFWTSNRVVFSANP